MQRDKLDNVVKMFKHKEKAGLLSFPGPVKCISIKVFVFIWDGKCV